MRVFLALGMTVAVALAACSGCSSTQMPALPTFGSKSEPKSSSSLAPPGPQIDAMAGTAPNVSVPPTAWNNLPVYPGTNYQQTPYPAHTVAQAPAPYASGPQGAASAQMAGGAGYAPSYGSMPPATAAPSNPYGASPATGGQTPPYAGTPAPAYPTQPAGGYTPQASAPYTPGSTASANGGYPPPGGAAPAYTAQQSPAPASTAAPNPYGATSEPYNANAPYGSYTR